MTIEHDSKDVTIMVASTFVPPRPPANLFEALAELRDARIGIRLATFQYLAHHIGEITVLVETARALLPLAKRMDRLLYKFEAAQATSHVWPPYRELQEEVRALEAALKPFEEVK